MLPDSRQKLIFAAILVAVLLVTPALVVGQGGERRVRPPQFDPADSRGVFFEDAFEEGLVGERPADLGGSVALPAGGGATPGQPAADPGAGGGNGSGFAWSTVISAETLENEVEAAKIRVDTLITTPGRFAGQDYKQARREFSLLALLMGIIAEYDGEVRWQDSAAASRDLFAHTAANCKVGTTQVFNEARFRQADLQDIVGGGTLQSEPEERMGDFSWEQVVDRTPLMQWLEHTEAALRPNTANENAFNANKDEVRRQAELMAAIAVALSQEGMDDVGDDDYDNFCQQLQSAAMNIAEATKLNNAASASQAMGSASQSCTECHQFYRG